MRVAVKIELGSEQRQQLESAPRSRSLPLRIVERARIVLLAAEAPQKMQSLGNCR